MTQNTQNPNGEKTRHVLLNSLPINAFRSLGEVTVRIKYLGRLSTLSGIVFEGESFISHPATAALVGTQTNKAFYEAKVGDTGYIFTLATPQRGPQDQQVSSEMVDVYWFEVKYDE